MLHQQNRVPQRLKIHKFWKIRYKLQIHEIDQWDITMASRLCLVLIWSYTNRRRMRQSPMSRLLCKMWMRSALRGMPQLVCVVLKLFLRLKGRYWNRYSEGRNSFLQSCGVGCIFTRISDMDTDRQDRSIDIVVATSLISTRTFLFKLFSKGTKDVAATQQNFDTFGSILVEQKSHFTYASQRKFDTTFCSTTTTEAKDIFCILEFQMPFSSYS